jgi:3-dehydroquinate dehydratase-2
MKKNKNRFFVINGPNLNLLGTRKTEVYGTSSLKSILHKLKMHAKEKGVKIGSYQSNHEGRLVDKVQSLSKKGYTGLIINPGAYTHYSYALRDAIEAAGIPAVEVHLSDIDKREAFRKVSVIKDVCIAQIKGLGTEGYLKGLDALLSGLSSG